MILMFFLGNILDRWIDGRSVRFMVNNIVVVRHSSVWLSLWFVWRKICTKQKIHFVRLLMIGKGKNFIGGLIRFCISKHICFLGSFFSNYFRFKVLFLLIFLFINSLIQNLLLKVLLNIFFDLHYNKYINILYMTYNCGWNICYILQDYTVCFRLDL